MRHAEKSLLSISTTLEKHGRDPEQKHLRMALLNGTSYAFTLIELLVVGLIIGILAAIALPQHQKAVEKSRLAEALSHVSQIETCFNWYILEHGLPPKSVRLQNMNCPVEINLGELDDENE